MPELLKRMYDYRMSIENMRVEVTVTKPVHASQPYREKIKQHFYFAYDNGRVRFDETISKSETPHMWLYQRLSTPDFYFIRHPSPSLHEVNDGNSLILTSPLTKPLATLDPRRIGTDRNHFDIIAQVPFSYDNLLDKFYPPKGEDFRVSTDIVDGEKLYKVSYQINDGEILNSYWINPQKGHSLVRTESKSEKLDRYTSYVVALEQFTTHKGEIWFPQWIVYTYEIKGNIVEERIDLNSVAFDVQDETPFTLVGLGIPVGYTVTCLGEDKYWDGKELVNEIPYTIEPANGGRWKRFLIVNAVILFFFALYFLYKFLQRRSN